MNELRSDVKMICIASFITSKYLPKNYMQHTLGHGLNLLSVLPIMPSSFFWAGCSS